MRKDTLRLASDDDDRITDVFEALGEDASSSWMDGLIERATREESNPNRNRAPLFKLQPGAAGVYRSTAIVPGMATYYVLTHAGEILGDELRSVRPDTMLEIETIAEMGRRFDELRPGLRVIR